MKSKDKREELLREVLIAWSHYESTGLHVTAEEVDAWLARLEEGDQIDPPECHT